MARKNPLIEELRDLGVSDYERRLLRQLSQEFERGDVYSGIEQLNRQLLDQAIKPVKLDYNTAVNLIKYGGYTVDEVIQQYKGELSAYKQGTTSSYEDWLERFTEELQDIGVTNATKENVRNADRGRLEYLYGRFRHYEFTGDLNGMEKTIRQIENELG